VGVYGGYRGIQVAGGEGQGQESIPPAFLVHAGDDSKAPVLASVELYRRLKEHGVPAELHVYERGEHGFALEKDRGAATTSTVIDWSRRLLEWLKVRGILQVAGPRMD
jgi:acetyl esterase/lipase